MLVRSLGWEDPLEEGMESTLVFLPTDRRVWRAMVHEVAKSLTQLKRLSKHIFSLVTGEITGCCN